MAWLVPDCGAGKKFSGSGAKLLHLMEQQPHLRRRGQEQSSKYVHYGEPNPVIVNALEPLVVEKAAK